MADVIILRYRAYRWVHREGAGAIEGIANADPIGLENIIGYEAERGLLVQNTEHFIYKSMVKKSWVATPSIPASRR